MGVGGKFDMRSCQLLSKLCGVSQWGGWTTVTGQMLNLPTTENDSTEKTECESACPGCRSSGALCRLKKPDSNLLQKHLTLYTTIKITFSKAI